MSTTVRCKYRLIDMAEKLLVSENQMSYKPATKPKRIFLIEDFKGNSLRACQSFARRLHKGFVRCGHDVFSFSYRDMQRQHSIFNYSSIFFIKGIGRHAASELMVSQIQNYNPDIIVFRAAVRKLDEKFVLKAKAAAPNAIIICWYVALYSDVHPNVLACAKHADFFISTSGGKNLERYKKAGIGKCAYMPFPCDPDLEHRYEEVDGKWKSNLLFTGKLDRKLPGQDSMRAELIKLLAEKRNLTVWGCLGKPQIYGMDYIYAINGAKIGISVNCYNDVRFSHSSRFMHYLACGTLVLAKYVPDSEMLFADGKHLRYFNTPDECLQLIDYYLENSREREAIAAAGMERAHSHFSCVNIVQDIFELINTGSYDKPWAEVL